MSCFPGRVSWTVAALAIVVVMAQVAEAQREGGRRGRGRGPIGVPAVQLAAESDDIQAALNLTAEQKEKVGEINDELREGRRNIFQQGGRDYRAVREEMEKLNQEASAKLAEVLNPEQQKQLVVITIKVSGANALMDTAVAKQLNVTDEQKAKLAEAWGSNFQAMREAREDLEDLSREERRAKERELRTEANQRLLAVLTDEQKTEYEQLRDESVDVDLSQFRGDRRGREGRGGRGGRGDRGGRDNDGGSSDNSN